MGTTTLFVVRAETPGFVEVYFKGRRGGAKRWQFIVDAFGDLVRAANDVRPGAIVRASSRRSLGQGLRLRMKPGTLLLFSLCASNPKGLGRHRVSDGPNPTKPD